MALTAEERTIEAAKITTIITILEKARERLNDGTSPSIILAGLYGAKTKLDASLASVAAEAEDE